MACDCIQRIEKLYTDKMIDLYPKGSVFKEVRFENTISSFDAKGKKSKQFVFTLLGEMRGVHGRGPEIEYFGTRLFPTYCPFCGKPVLRKDKEGGER